MPTINDYKKATLKTLTGTNGDINTLESKWLKSVVAPYVGAIPDMWRKYLTNLGYTDYSIDQKAMRYLGDLGYTGSITNRWYQYWKNGGPIPLARSLFRSGEDGFLFQAFPKSILFQDTAGSVPVTTNDDPVGRANDQSGKGNNVIQATAANRPIWKSNSGKPYLNLDGSNDILVDTFVPGAAITLAAACRITVGATFIIGGGDSAGNRRCFLGLEGNGKIAGGWGSQSTNVITSVSGDLRGQDHVLLMTADASTVSLWLDGVNVYTGASIGTASTTTSPIGLGALNNAGVSQNWVNGRVSAALALNRRATPAEIGQITSSFRSTF